MSKSALLLLALASGVVLQAAESPTIQTIKADSSWLTTSGALSPRPIRYLSSAKTQGEYHLTGLVRKDGSVFLRWANSEGEMPTAGVIVSRLREGEVVWKELNANAPTAFFDSPGLDTRLAAMNSERREKLLSFFHGEITEDDDDALPSAQAGTASKDVSAVRVSKLTAPEVIKQYKSLRQSGKLEVSHMQLLQVNADLDPDASDLLGLQYIDTPKKGARYRYKITVRLPESGEAVVELKDVFDPESPTVLPLVTNLSAKSGNGTVLLDWDAPESSIVTGYNLYRSDNANGPFTKINGDPIKKVQLELEAPDVALRRSKQHRELFLKSVKQSGEESLTKEQAAVHTKAADQALEKAGSLPALSARERQVIDAAVNAGRLAPGGLIKPVSTYTDRIGVEGNEGFKNEKTYFYKVRTLDISGAESPLSTAPTISGTPKDLEPPSVPARPSLATEQQARLKLHATNRTRSNEPSVVELNSAVRAKQTKTPSSFFSLAPRGQTASSAPRPPLKAAATPAVRPELAALSLSELQRDRRLQSLRSLPFKELAEFGQATQLFSKADGSVPAAKLVWAAQNEPDFKEFVIYRAEDKGAFVRLGSSAQASWTDSSLKIGLQYRYVLSAVDRLGNESGRSGECVVQVRDGGLKDKLALKTKAGEGTSTPPASSDFRSFSLARDWTIKGTALSMLSKEQGSLNRVKVPAFSKGPARFAVSSVKVEPQMSRSALVLRKVPSDSNQSAGSSRHAASALQSNKRADGAAVVTTELPLLKRSIKRSYNAMLVGRAAAPKEVYAVLTWAKPIDHLPLDYQVYQASQTIELVQEGRGSQNVVKGSLDLTGVKPDKSGAGRTYAAAASKSKAATPQAQSDKAAASSRAKAAGGRPDLRAEATAGIALSSTRGTLSVAGARREMLVRAKLGTGPGAFSLVNSAPVKAERYVVKFPAEVAQYGGATYYYRVQPRAMELGHLVEGPQSELIEVRLPDIIAPPVPSVGAVDLKPNGPEKLDVVVSWTHNKVPDLAGFLVDRQAMNFKWVEGEATATTALESTARRLTESPVTPLTWTDTDVSGGFYRYTIRSVDKTGNISEARDELDVYVPLEARPEAPGGLNLNGGKLTWTRAQNASSYTVWRSFTGDEGDYECISPILKDTDVSYSLPEGAKGHFRVVSRSVSGRYLSASQSVQ